MTYFGRLLSTELLVHAKRTGRAAPARAEAPAPTPTRTKRNGSYWFHRRARMFREQDGKCHWCHGLMALVDRRPGARDALKSRAENEATIEHLDSRLSPERGAHPGERRLVLACNKCNGDRGAAEFNAVPIQTLWERSGAIRYIAKRDGALNEVGP